MKQLIENLSKYKTLAELRSSEFFTDYGRQIEKILTNPEIQNCHAASPRLKSFLRVAQWNIEKGRRFDRILEKLRSDEVLRWADVIFLNEGDRGMNRSGNRHVALDLALSLQMRMAFAPAHFELTKGTAEDLALPGENQQGLQGNAILSRYPILDAKIVALPQCYEPYRSTEKRYGRRNCLWVQLGLGSRSWWVGSTHLEVRDTPQCRARQLMFLLANLPGSADEPHLLGGDLNSNGFSRGTLWRTLQSLWRLTARSSARVKEELMHPERGKEPLFGAAKNSGFFWEGLNSNDDTACTQLEDLEDADLLPKIVRALVDARLRAYEGSLHFKLDWFLGRDVRGLRKGEVHDRTTGVSSRDPGIRTVVRAGMDRISDHLPLHVDLAILPLPERQTTQR